MGDGIRVRMYLYYWYQWYHDLNGHCHVDFFGIGVGIGISVGIVVGNFV